MKCIKSLLLFVLLFSFVQLSIFSEVKLTDEQYQQLKDNFNELEEINENSKRSIKELENIINEREKLQEISEKMQARQNDYIETLEISLEKSTKQTTWERVKSFFIGLLSGGLILNVIYTIYQ